MDETSNNLAGSQVIEYLKNLDTRISKIESLLRISSSGQQESEENILPSEYSAEPDTFELNFGEHWFANIGILVLTFGLLLLLTFGYQNYPQYLPGLAGYITSALAFFAAKVLVKNYSLISKQLSVSALALIYFSTLRLFHFSESPFFTNTGLETFLLMAVSAFGLFIAHKKKSDYLTGLSLALVMITGLVINNEYLFNTLMIIVPLLFMYRFKLQPKTSFIVFGIFIVYLSNIFWSLNNPFVTGEFIFGSASLVELFILFFTALIFSFPNVIFKYNSDETDRSVMITMFNGLFCFAIILINLLRKSEFDFALVEFSLLLFFLVMALLHWKKGSDQYSKAVYALLGFAGLTLGIIKISPTTSIYIFLIWQSLLVAGVAIMFKSKNLIVANFLIFLFVFVAYLATVTSIGIIGLSFGIVALISARIMNWQKHKLTVKTELIRNTYLAVAFFSIPITLLSSLPATYGGLALLGVTVLYYTLGIMLRNSKYRFMGHFTLILTILYSVIFSASSSEIEWTVITFIAIGMVLVGVSFTFTKIKLKSGENDIQPKNS